MLEYFVDGFHWVFCVLLAILGGASAFILFAMAVIVIALVGLMIFYMIMELMAHYWEKTGTKPGHKLGQIIMRRRASRTDSEV